MRHRRKVRTISFKHELVHRRRRHGVADVLAVLKGDDASVTHQPVERQNLLEALNTFTETMKHPAGSGCKWLDLRKQISEGTALMNDAVQAGFSGDFQLLPKNLRL